MVKGMGFVFYLLAYVFVMSTSCQAAADEATYDDVVKSARNGLNDLLKDKRLVNNHLIGFANKADVDDAELGEGFQIFTVPPDKLIDESVSQDLQSIIVPTTQWKFIIAAGNRAQALLDVNLVNGKWLATAIGASTLAKEMSGFIKTWPASSGFRYRFVRVYSLGLDFIELSREGSVIGMIPLNDLMLNNKTRSTGVFIPGDLHDSKEVLTELKTRVKRNYEMRNKLKSLPTNSN